MKRQRPGPNYESRLLAAFLAVALPALIGTGIALAHAFGWGWEAALGFVAVALPTLGLALFFRRRMVFPLYTLGNLLEALREGDYSLRGARARRGDAVGEVVMEINALAQTLRTQRLAVEEKGAQLVRTLEALDIAVFSFDPEGFLTLANPAALQLLGTRRLAELDGRSAAALGLAPFLAQEGARVTEHAFPGGSGRWEIRHARFRTEGRVHDLLVVSDLSRALREEERLAWQRLIRVLGHELNNSLAPIRSMAGTVGELLAREPLPADWREDAGTALAVIGDRADALARFMGRYTQLARLPPPRPREVDLRELACRVARLEQRLEVRVRPTATRALRVDPDQIEQALINLVRNAADAVLEVGTVTEDAVVLDWRADGDAMLVEVADRGPGLPPSANLFVPFFTTKPGGSGIGLVLARQIVEQHGGRFALENRPDGPGCIARLWLPVAD